MSMASGYDTLDYGDLILIARDVLRAKESDHFRATIENPENPGVAERLAQLDADRTRAKKVLKQARKAAEDAGAQDPLSFEPAPEEPVVPAPAEEPTE